MAGIYKLQEIQAKNESVFAENAEAPASNSYTKRYPFTSATLNVSQPRVRDGGMRSRTNEEALTHPSIRTATLDIESYLYGHLTTTAGALTQTNLQEELSTALGGSNLASIGTTLTAASSAPSR